MSDKDFDIVVAELEEANHRISELKEEVEQIRLEKEELQQQVEQLIEDLAVVKNDHVESLKDGLCPKEDRQWLAKHIYSQST